MAAPNLPDSPQEKLRHSDRTTQNPASFLGIFPTIVMLMVNQKTVKVLLIYELIQINERVL